MIKKHRILLARILFLGDLTVIFVSWILAYWLRFNINLIPATKGPYSFSYHMSMAIVVLTIWGLALQFSGLYKFKRLTSRSKALKTIFNASLMATLIFIAATYLFQEYRFSRGVVSYFLGTSFVLLFAFRLIFREVIFHLRRRGFNLRHVIVVGTGPLATYTIQKIKDHSETGVNIVQTVSPHKMDDLCGLIKKQGIDQVIIALEAHEYEYVSKVLHLLRNETADVKIVPEFYRFASLQYDIEDLDGLPFITLNDTPMDGWNAALKRGIDILLGSLFFLIALPIMTLIAILIKIFTPGPIFYSQERVGLDGKRFKIFKFRTMKINAEKETGAVWAKENDNRRTRLGSFLRKTSLDELPQFLNIILGNMSIVGPRPERPVFVDKFKDHYPNYMLRHKVKAGLTGWAQVNGWRGNTDLQKRIEHDLYYIKNWSALFDIKIIWLTLWRGIFHKNAY